MLHICCINVPCCCNWTCSACFWIQLSWGKTSFCHGGNDDSPSSVSAQFRFFSTLFSVIRSPGKIKGDLWYVWGLFTAPISLSGLDEELAKLCSPVVTRFSSVCGPGETRRISSNLFRISLAMAISNSFWFVVLASSNRSISSCTSPWVWICFWSSSSFFVCLWISLRSRVCFSTSNLWRSCCAPDRLALDKSSVCKNLSNSIISFSFKSALSSQLLFFKSSDLGISSIDDTDTERDESSVLLLRFATFSLGTPAASATENLEESFEEIDFPSALSRPSWMRANFSRSRASISFCFSQTSSYGTAHERLVTACGLELQSLYDIW